MDHPSITFMDDANGFGRNSPIFGAVYEKKEQDAETLSFMSRRPSRSVQEQNAVEVTNRFTKAVTLLLYIMSLMGMRPFAICFRKTKPSECEGSKNRLASYSIVGSMIWLCACLTQTFMTAKMFSPMILCTRRFGFFHMKTVIYAQQFAMHLFTISLLFILMRNAASIHKLFHGLNRIELPRKEYEKFRKRALIWTYVGIVQCLLVEFVFFWYGLKNADREPDFKLSTMLAFIIDICFLMAAMTLPVGLFVLVCHFLVAAFRHNRHKFAAQAEISVEHLRVCYEDYLQLALLTDDVSECFEDFMFVNMLFLIPVICTTALNLTRFGSFVVIVITFFLAAISTFVLLMYHGIWLNEEARQVRCCLYAIFSFDQSIKSGIDHVMHKVNDWSWGVRIGKMMVMDRTTCIAILSAMITFVALWAQLSTNSEMCDNGETLVWNETAIVNNMFMDQCE